MSASPDEDASLPAFPSGATRLPSLTPRPGRYSFDSTPPGSGDLPSRAAIQMRSTMRTSRSCLLLALATLMSHAGLARAQTCPPMNDPICVTTATRTRYGNAPAPYDPADVAVVPTCFGGTLLGPIADRPGTPRYPFLFHLCAPS